VKPSEVEIAISELLDGHLEHEATLSLIDRLLQCEKSRKFYLDSRLLDKRLAEVRAHEPEEPMSDKLWRRIRGKSELPASSRPWFVRVPAWVPVLAAAVFVLVMGLGIYRAFLTADPLSAEQVLQVSLESRKGVMTDQRFLRIAKEVLESDRKYQLKMLEVMREVSEYYPEMEGDRNDEFTGEEGGAEARPRDDGDV